MWMTMKAISFMILLLVSIFMFYTAASLAGEEVVIVEDEVPRAAICVPDGLMADDISVPRDAAPEERDAEMGRRRLRESVNDLLKYVEKMSGTQLSLYEDGMEEADSDLTPIYVGELARDVFGSPEKSYIYDQGWRLVAGEDGIGLIGESDTAASYALYEVLHQLGCRWYMPGELGEHIPELKTLSLPKQDTSAVPNVAWSSLWRMCRDFMRRNRLGGGRRITYGHGLEGWITDQQREENPEWRAVINGKPHPRKLKWTREDVAEAMAENIIDSLQERYRRGINLSPMDSIGWDESEDPEYDADDWDSAMETVSKTDRLLVLTNRVAERVNEEFPEVHFGVLAYVDYTRPPVREPVHPNVVPVLAPITYNRAHPMTWDDYPNPQQLLEIVRGWHEVTDRIAYHFYGYNLSETWAPNPFLTKWSEDLPILFEAEYPHWQVETMSNFETTLLGLYLGIRLSWDRELTPEEITEELMDNFYGAAAEEMYRYWRHIDAAWVETDDYSGAAWGYRRRFTPEVMREARRLMDEAMEACETEAESWRVEIANESLRQFERFMQMLEDQAEGRFSDLESDYKQWRERMKDNIDRFEDNYAFGVHRGRAESDYRFVYVDRPHGNTWRDASRIAREFRPLEEGEEDFAPLRNWRIKSAPDGDAEENQDWHMSGYDDADWRTTNVSVDTWSHLGYHNYFDKMMYRKEVDVPEVPSGRDVYLWLPATDGSAKLYVNGEHVPYITGGGDSREAFTGYGMPGSFKITEALRPGERNLIAFLCKRTGLNEVGTGGLLGAPVLYREP